MNDFPAIQQQNTGIAPVDPAAIASAESAKARIQSAYIMAMNRPRNQDNSRDRILHACKRPTFAEKVEFSKPVGGRTIKGPSVRFAELALREWGNVLTDVQVLYEDDNTRRSRIMVVDLETNTSFSKEIQVSKTVERKNRADREVLGVRRNTNGQEVFIVKATDDELHNKEAALISKAIRNEGLRVIPSDIVEEALETAKKTLRDKDKEDPDAAKKKVLDAFSDIGVKPKDVQAFLGHSTDAITPAELQDLRGMYSAIRDGEAKWADYVQPPKKEEPAKDGKPKGKKTLADMAETAMIDCPNIGKPIEAAVCATCTTREGCPTQEVTG
jgi:hypothetical protein